MSKESNLKAWEEEPKWICGDCGNHTFLLRILSHPLDGIFPDIYCSKCGSMVLLDFKARINLGEKVVWKKKNAKSKS